MRPDGSEAARLPDLLHSLIDGLGLMALLAVLYGVIERLKLKRDVRSALHGLSFGLGAVAAMMSPAILAPGVLVDSRATFVAVSGAFVGPIAAVIAALVAAAFRAALGGAGMVPGLVTVVIAFVVGLTWRYAWFERRPVTPFALLLLALGISLQIVLIPFLPVAMTPLFMLAIASTTAAGAVFATVVLCAMMLRENRQIAREKSLLDDAFTDALTGLPNRRAVYGAETSVLAASQARGYVALILDVDHFKTVNDRFGHDAGDAALCILARTLKDGSRLGDVVGRVGGEEFVVLLPDTRGEDGQAVAQRLIALARERRVAVPGAEFGVTVSIGLAHAHASVRLADAVARADEGLYRAKAEGRDRLVVAAPLPAVQLSAETAPASVRVVARSLSQRSP